MAESEPKLHVCYHYPCPDGIGGCLATALGLTKHIPSSVSLVDAIKRCNIQFHALEIYKPIESRIATAQAQFGPNDTVYLVDFSGGRAFIEECCKLAKDVYLLDHHKTAQEDLSPPFTVPTNLHLHVDMGRSGAGIARDFFGLTHDAVFVEKLGKETHARLLDMLALIEDGDLWRHADPRSKPFAAGFSALNLELNVNANPSLFDTLLALDTAQVVESGVKIQEEQARIIAEEISKAFPIRITAGEQTLDALAVLTCYGDLRSTMGNELANVSKARGYAPVGIVAYKEARMGEATDSMTKVSLRSLKGFDTTVFSKAYGGGGHKEASSCIVTDEVFAAWKAAAATS